MDLAFVSMCSCVFRLDPSILLFSSSAAIVGLTGSSEVGAMMVARLRLAPVLVVVSRCSMDLDVILVFFVLL